MRRIVIWLCALVCLAACSTKSSTPLSGGSQAPDARLSAAATLQDRMPKDTIGYARLPSPFGAVVATRDRTMDAARIHDAHIKTLTTIRNGLQKMPELQSEDLAPLKIALAHWQSPLEIAYVAPGRVAMAPPKVLGRVLLPGLTADQLFKAVSAAGPAKRESSGMITGEQFALRFDESTGELLVVAGPNVKADDLDKLMTDPLSEPPFAAAQAKSEQSRQGLFVWLDLAAMQPLVATGAMMNPELAPLINALAMDGKALTISGGTANKKGRIAIELSAPAGKLLTYLPRERKTWQVKTVGAPDFFASLSLLPSPAEWTALSARLTSDYGPEVAEPLGKADAELRKALGISLNDVLAALGPDVGLFNDRAGSFLAIRLRDKEAWQRVLDQINTLPNTTLKQAGNIFLLDLRMPSEKDADPMVAALSRMRTSVAWVEDDGYLVFASLAQPLRDRKSLKADTAIADWLAQTQGHRAEHSALAAFGPSHDVQRSTWYAWIGALGAMADIARVEVDLTQLPSAAELGLPREGFVGIEWQVSPDHMGVALSYDATPLDVFGASGGVQSVAIVGILAAIAIPAYQDYSARAEVTNALSETGSAKTTLIESMLATNAVPGSLEELEIDGQLSGGHTMVWENGMLLIRFGATSRAGLAGTQLALGVRWNEGSPTWVCGYAEPDEPIESFVGENPAVHTTVDNKRLPRSCQRPGS